MSTTTETGFEGKDLPESTTGIELLPETPEQDQDQQGHEHGHEHNHDGGELTPMCSGNGCVQKTSSN